MDVEFESNNEIFIGGQSAFPFSYRISLMVQSNWDRREEKTTEKLAGTRGTVGFLMNLGLK